MPVNLMQGKLDGGDDNNEKKSNSIDLTLEKNSKDTSKSTPKVDAIKPEKHPEVKEIKVKVPSDIRLEETKLEGGSIKIVAGIVALLMVSTGVLLFLLNSESQDLRGSVNVLPETNSTQIVDDILAEDFTNEASQNATETEQVEVDDNNTVSSSVDDEILNSADDSTQPETTTEDPEESVDEPLVVDTSSIISQTNIEDEPSANLPSEEINEPVETPSNDEIIQDYDIQTSQTMTDELLTDVSNNTNNDFAPEITESNVTVMEEVSESEEIQGETGPGLWISVIVASILSYAYARRDERQLG
jgi:hypothetical protein